MSVVSILLLILSIVLLVAGLIGCFVPVIPGPPVSFVGLCMLHLSGYATFSIQFFIVMGIITAAVTIADYIVPVAGAKKFGGSKAGIWGTTIGLILGLFFFPPLGIIVGPFVGALVGELISGKKIRAALKASLGSLLGFLFGTVMKFVVSGLMIYYAITGIM